jgi:putative transposase
MTRPLRLSFDNAIYHVMARGNRRENIFYSEADNKNFLEKMNETFNKYSMTCYAYCLMNTHYHLFIKTRLPNVTQAMHYLNSSYANWFKAKNQIVGVVFQGRYKSILVEESKYALSLSTYIHLNPLRAGLVRSLRLYPWSSYLDYIGVRKPQIDRLDTSLVLGLVTSDAELARDLTKKQIATGYQRVFKAYEDYVSTMGNMKNPLDEAHKGIILGGPGFVNKVKKRISSLGVCREIPTTSAQVSSLVTPDNIAGILANSLGIKKENILTRCKKQRRNSNFKLFLYLLKKGTPLSLREIGNLVDMDYAAVHQTVKRFEAKLGMDAAALDAKETVEKAIAEWIARRPQSDPY